MTVKHLRHTVSLTKLLLPAPLLTLAPQTPHHLDVYCPVGLTGIALDIICSQSIFAQTSTSSAVLMWSIQDCIRLPSSVILSPFLNAAHTRSLTAIPIACLPARRSVRFRPFLLWLLLIARVILFAFPDLFFLVVDWYEVFLAAVLEPLLQSVKSF